VAGPAAVFVAKTASFEHDEATGRAGANRRAAGQSRPVAAARGAEGDLKSTLKALGNMVALALVAPVWLGYAALAAVFGAERIFPGASQLISLAPGVTGQYLRRAFYWLALPECGRDVCIAFQTVLSHPTARLGHHVYVGVGCMVGDATLGENVLMGSHASIINGARQHDISRLDVPVRLQPGVYPRITVGEDTWIGDRAVVMADVGRHCVVGAAAVVTKPVPDYAIVVGNPARIIGWRKTAPELADANDTDAERAALSPHQKLSTR
jgi:acetyltransferase-like isoleucine patch superfamily enzyme